MYSFCELMACGGLETVRGLWNQLDGLYIGGLTYSGKHEVLVEPLLD